MSEARSGPATGAPPPHKIGIIGAECTGKSTLAADIAAAIGAEVVTEALRDFVARTGRAPTRDEQPAVMEEQVRREDAAVLRAAERGSLWVICDPSALMTAIYSMAYFDDESLLPSAIAHLGSYAVTLWCRPDFDWEPDPSPAQRDGAPRRDQVDRLIGRVIEGRRLEAAPVSGSPESRLERALEILRRLS